MQQNWLKNPLKKRVLQRRLTDKSRINQSHVCTAWNSFTDIESRKISLNETNGMPVKQAPASLADAPLDWSASLDPPFLPAFTPPVYIGTITNNDLLLPHKLLKRAWTDIVYLLWHIYLFQGCNRDWKSELCLVNLRHNEVLMTFRMYPIFFTLH